jgi:hypothetical protein
VHFARDDMGEHGPAIGSFLFGQLCFLIGGSTLK